MYCQHKDTVLDICGGKGGDFKKWMKAIVDRIVLADIAEESVRQAVDRYNELRNPGFSAEFICADCSIPGVIKSDGTEFDIVSCQFSLHYSFGSERAARGIMENITASLKPGGYFIGTIPDANILLRRARLGPGLRFGNSVYQVIMDRKDKIEPYGTKYTFTLQDAVEGVPEYLIHFESFRKLADEYGLELVLRENFHEFFNAHMNEPGHKELLEAMRCLNRSHSISAEEWEAIGLYLVFAFIKKGPSLKRGIDGQGSRQKIRKVEYKDIRFARNSDSSIVNY